MRDGRPAIALVLERIPATLVLTIPALLAAKRILAIVPEARKLGLERLKRVSFDGTRS